MAGATLILNADFSPLTLAPLSVLSWKEAVKLIWLDQVDVLEHYADWFVHSPSITMQVPSVVVCRDYVKNSRSVKFNKLNLCIRDEFTCQYCSRELEKNQLTMDHVIPKCRGGKTNWTNLVAACSRCNTLKGHKTNIKPRKEPTRPGIGEIISKARRMPIMIPNENWIPYIGWNPRLVTVKEPNKNIDT